MSDESANHFEQDTPKVEESPQEGRSLTLAVTLHPNGQLDFQFPKTNKTTLYGLLELARAQLDKTFLLMEVKASQPKRNGMDGLLRRMGGS